jgi:hypothetical protein
MHERLQRRSCPLGQVAVELVCGSRGLEQLSALCDLVARRAADVVSSDLGEVVERAVEQVLDPPALPEADPECRREHGQAHEQPAAELIKVADDTESIVIADRSEAFRHGHPEFVPLVPADQEGALSPLN